MAVHKGGTKLRQSYQCGETIEPLVYETIADRLRESVEQFPNKEALIVCHQGIRWTYEEFQREITRLATGLIHSGIEPGDRVAIWAPNCYQWCLTQFATAQIGAILVCVNPAYRIFELEYALNMVQCKAIVTAEKFKSSDYLDMLNQLAPELANCDAGHLTSERLHHLKIVIRMGDDVTSGMFNFDEVCNMGTADDAAQLEQVTIQLQPDDPINIQFTSGTTGSPKGATLTHFNILNNARQVAAGMNFSTCDRLCIPVPLYHCFGMVMGMLACVSSGATAIFPADTFDPAITLASIDSEKCTALLGVPTMFLAELERPDFEDYDLSSLRTGVMSGAPCPEEIMKLVMSKMNMSEVTIMYGQTETSPVNHMTAIDDPIRKRVGTVGRAGPHVEIKIVGIDGVVVPIGETGELCCRGYSVMRGYWGDDDRTRETIDVSGWLHSGDLAVMDDEGYVQIAGRIKDMIIRGGENIYPRELEEFLYTHPMIQEVQVFGIPDREYGEQVCAWIKITDVGSLTAEDVHAYCADKIAHFKVPRRIEFVEEFPMTVTGKIQKFKMRESVVESVDSE